MLQLLFAAMEGPVYICPLESALTKELGLLVITIFTSFLAPTALGIFLFFPNGVMYMYNRIVLRNHFKLFAKFKAGSHASKLIHSF